MSHNVAEYDKYDMVYCRQETISYFHFTKNKAKERTVKKCCRC